jgi:hypothetical protein
MKKSIFLISSLLILQSFPSFSNHIIDPIRNIQISDNQPIMDNPRGKIKIRFVSTADKSDTTKRPKGFFAKIKNVFNALLDASDNPPFKIEVVREKEKKN